MWTYRPDEHGIMRLMYCHDLKRHGHLPTEDSYDEQAYFTDCLERRPGNNG